MSIRNCFYVLMISSCVLACSVSSEERAADPTDHLAQELPTAILEIVTLDIWGQPLDNPSLEISNFFGETIPTSSEGIDLYQAGSLLVTLSATDYKPNSLIIDFDGTDGLLGLQMGPLDDRQAAVLSHESRLLSPGSETMVHTLVLGLHHRWFSSQGRPARLGNHLDLLLDGESSTKQMKLDIQTAKKSIAATTWWWNSNFELERPKATHVNSTLAQRRSNTVMDLFRTSPATKRVIVTEFMDQDGHITWLNTDDEIRALGSTPNDNFEYMSQANTSSGVFDLRLTKFSFADRVQRENPEFANRSFEYVPPISSSLQEREITLIGPLGIEVPHASFHQKLLLVDSKVAYVNGFNLTNGDWDTSKHLVFDSRRMAFDASREDRLAVLNKETLPDKTPIKDYGLRIDGPIVQDVASVFSDRWQTLRNEQATNSQYSSTFTYNDQQAYHFGGIQAQLTTTMPAPYNEHSIAETWMNAVNNAENFIFIEDQYFRAPMLFDAIVKRMQARPSLQLIVVTNPISEWTDLGCSWTNRSHTRFANMFPNRYHIFELTTFDTAVSWGIDETDAYFENIYIHSKLLIVDDKFMSVGSANKNNRGMTYEAEMNVAIFDRNFVKESRVRIVRNMLGQSIRSGTPWYQQMEEAAEYNDWIYDNWDYEGMDISLDGAPLPYYYQTIGFLNTLEFGTVSDCFIESVSPDLS